MRHDKFSQQNILLYCLGTIPVIWLALRMAPFMLNHAAKDREKLAKLLNISNEQMSYVTNADAGCGLIRYGRALVPFINRFPKDTELYKLMTTRPGEGVFGVGRDG